jgi:sarcosine/dimethylglycine N-methyltransferase
MTEAAVTPMEMFLQSPPGPLGLHIFVDGFVEKANNLVRGLSDGRLRAVQGLAVAGP